MGIDIYLTDHKCADTMEENAFKCQRAYIRESYHGDIFPSRTFLPESFDGDVIVSYDQLKARLADTVKLAIERAQKTYNLDNIDEIQEVIKPYFDFLDEVANIEGEGKEAWVANSY